MREFVIDAEMTAAAEADKREMWRLRDEIERFGFVFESTESFDLKEPQERIRRPDGSWVLRQWITN